MRVISAMPQEVINTSLCMVSISTVSCQKRKANLVRNHLKLGIKTCFHGG